MASDPVAFRTIAIDAPYAAQTIKKRLIERKHELGAQIAAGYAKDWPDYKERIGALRGLDEAIAIAEDMEKKERQ